jgi:ATP-dependent DNA helicase RecG
MQLDLLDLLEPTTIDSLWKPDEIFRCEDGEFLASLAEDARFEKKSARIKPSELATYLSAFGNGPAIEGGVLVIGIEDDGRITGCRTVQSDKIALLELMGRDNCTSGRFESRRVPVKNASGEDDFLIVARIYYVEDRLVELTNGISYCRESNRVRRLTESEKQEIRIDKGERAFELEPTSLDYPDQFRQKSIEIFANRIRSSVDGSSEVSDEEVLVSCRLGEFRLGKFVPNNACVLMFANDPQRTFPGAYIHFLRYEGTKEGSGDEYNIIQDRMISGTLVDVIQKTTSHLQANLREFTVFRSGKFYTGPEYPYDAWYEMIVNACVHRSYHSKTEPIFLKMFDDHLVVESPGGFMPSIGPGNLVHKPRNPFLMFVLREYGEVRCIGEGTKRIVREVQQAQLPEPNFSGTAHRVTVTLFNDILNRTNSLDSEAYKVLGEAIAFGLDPEERRIINYIIEKKKINVSDALRLMSTTYWHTARNKLQRLVSRGILDFISTKQRDPNSYYILRSRD